MKWIVMVVMVSACSQKAARTPDPEAAECIAHRTAKQLECDDLFKTRAEIDACRAKVRAEIECVKDGGARD